MINLDNQQIDQASNATGGQLAVSKEMPFERLPVWLNALIAGSGIGMVYSLMTKIHPLRSISVISIHTCALFLTEPASKKLTNDPIMASAIRIMSLVAVQLLIKQAYKSVNMFTTIGGNIFFWGLSATLIGFNSIELIQAIQQRSKKTKVESA